MVRGDHSGVGVCSFCRPFRRVLRKPSATTLLTLDMLLEVVASVVSMMLLLERSSALRSGMAFVAIARMQFAITFGAIKAMPSQRLALVVLASLWHLSILILFQRKFEDFRLLLWVNLAVVVVNLAYLARRGYLRAHGLDQPDLNALATARVAAVEIGGAAFTVAPGSRPPVDCVGTDGSTCAICMLEYAPGDVVRQLACTHCFHEACLHGWLRQGRGDCRCPMRCDEDDRHGGRHAEGQRRAWRGRGPEPQGPSPSRFMSLCCRSWRRPAGRCDFGFPSGDAIVPQQYPPA